MVTFDSFREGRRDSGKRGRGRSDRGDFEDRSRSFEDKSRRFGDRRREPRFNKNRRDVEMTKVICSACGDECEVPFKPTSNKPIYCSDCFSNTDKGSDRSSNRNSRDSSNRDLDMINEKLNKIMNALDIN